MKSNILNIFKKEFNSYFTSPMAYIFLVVFCLVNGYFFSNTFFLIGQSDLRALFNIIPMVYLFFVPAITMSLIAKEKNLGTMEIICTLPIKDHEFVIGKYLATLQILIGTLLPTVWYVILLYWFGNPDLWPLLTSYIGLLLFGGATLAIGLLASSLTSNQVLAAVMSFGLLLLLTLTNKAALVTVGLSATILEEISLTAHFEDFARGIVDVGNVVYYLTVIGIFVFATIRSLESRRWR